MRNQTKKLLSLVAAATMLTSALAFSACGDYKLDEALSLPETEATVNSNGGFAVEKDGFVYFINGAEDYTASNKYGDVVKGSLMRIATEDLNAGNYDKADVVVPMLVGSQNFNTGIYIYGDYVYYATPTTGKNLQGVVENSWIDFKCAKLDGSETMKDYFFRLSSNSANFRFVEIENEDKTKTVYCLYEEGGMLKSYNTETKETYVLAKGAGTYYFDQKDPTNPNVYYTMGVTYDVDSAKASTAAYNQIYTVRADAKATVNAKEASYTVENGKTYDFDKEYLTQVNEDAKKAANENKTDYTATYDFNDYTTYPYVNLGTLVVDGIGSNYEAMVAESAKIPYNNSTETNAELQGYKYTITRYENGGVYYTRGDGAKLYYYNSAEDTNATAKEVNANKNADVVALNTTNASASALFAYDSKTGEHEYIYLSGNDVYRATTVNGEDVEEVRILTNASGKTLWKTEGEYLYYYGSGSTLDGNSTSGNQLSRVKYTGEEENYHNLLINEEYKPVTLKYVDFASSWYKPEMIGNTLLFANAQSVGSTSYNYIYATAISSNADIKANNEAFEKVYEYFNDELTMDVKNAATYLFRTYKRDVEDKDQKFFVDYAEVQNLYKEANKEEISWLSVFEEDVVALLKNKTYIVESDLIHLLGAVNEADEEEMRESWKSYLPYPVEEEEEGGLPVWAIVLIVVGSVLVAAAGVTVPLVILHQKKLKKEEEEKIVNAYKREKIDTTDDKSIDVYADDTAEEAPKSENE